MLVIGIAGGVGSGKSSVARHFASLGAVSFDADQIGHEVLGEMDVKEQLVGRWGASVTNGAGVIDRAAVAKIVFDQSPEALRELSFLEEVMHPRIAQRLKERILWICPYSPSLFLAVQNPIPLASQIHKL